MSDRSSRFTWNDDDVEITNGDPEEDKPDDVQEMDEGADESETVEETEAPAQDVVSFPDGTFVPAGQTAPDTATRALVAEAIRETLSSVFSSTFRGAFPIVATLPEVDVAELTAGDVDPFYVTLRLAQIGAISANGILYDEALVNDIYTRILAKRVPARYGHVPEAEEDTAFPIGCGFWIGAVMVGNVLWGKAYIFPGEWRDYLRRLKAVGGEIGTSIYGKGVPMRMGDGVMRYVDFVLESIDFAPPERASLKMGGQFVVTREMEGKNMGDKANADEPLEAGVFDDESSETGEETVTETIQELVGKMKPDALKAHFGALLKQMSPADVQECMSAVSVKEFAALIPASYQPAIAEQYASAAGMKLVANADASRVSEMSSTVADLSTRLAEYQSREFVREIGSVVDGYFKDWNVRGEENQKKVNAVRETFQSKIKAKVGDDKDVAALAAIAQDVWENGDVKTLAEMARDSMAGPSAIIGGRAKPEGKLADPATAQAARSNLGF